VRFEFPAREGLAALKFWWYDGNPADKSTPPLRPPPELTKDLVEVYEKVPDSGFLLVGDKGKLFSPNDYGGNSLLMLEGEPGYTAMEKHEAAQAVPQTIPRSPGHNEEWFRMMRDGTPAYSNFAIASQLTEIVLLGCVAVEVSDGHRMIWNGEQMRSPSCADAAQYVQRHNRAGWTV
jgi:hypothetical protein